MSLFELFLNNKDRPIHKWIHYFPIYERFFAQFVNKSIIFIEIGVYRGGSMRMWRKYFGPYATIIGIDIEPACSQFADKMTYIEIGDQKDQAFLERVLEKYGEPDIVLDDGSHTQEDIWGAFQYLYPHIRNNGIYFVEDLHTCYWPSYGGGLGKSDTFIEKSKDFIDLLNSYHFCNDAHITEFARTTHSICYFDSICVFEKMTHSRPYALEI